MPKAQVCIYKPKSQHHIYILFPMLYAEYWTHFSFVVPADLGSFDSPWTIECPVHVCLCDTKNICSFIGPKEATFTVTNRSLTHWKEPKPNREQDICRVFNQILEQEHVNKPDKIMKYLCAVFKTKYGHPKHHNLSKGIYHKFAETSIRHM